MSVLKRIASNLPSSWQQELKRMHYHRQIRRQTFVTDEPEFLVLDELVSNGDWVIDIGANVGHYTRRLSDLVGPAGRVIAVEPVPETFALLADNAVLFQHRNVTLLNAAASDRTSIAGISVPSFDTGLKNYYQASITNERSDFRVMTIAIDALNIGERVCLAKIDAEGHDPAVLRGMARLLERDHPTLVVETSSPEAAAYLAGLDYRSERFPGSSNLLYTWNGTGGR
jgi:FkbM family methyltransferase